MRPNYLGKKLRGQNLGKRLWGSAEICMALRNAPSGSHTSGRRLRLGGCSRLGRGRGAGWSARKGRLGWPLVAAFLCGRSRGSGRARWEVPFGGASSAWLDPFDGPWRGLGGGRKLGELGGDRHGDLDVIDRFDQSVRSFLADLLGAPDAVVADVAKRPRTAATCR